MFDAYAHLGVPRFQTLEDYKETMRLLGIEKALVCPFDACPDLDEVHRAMSDPAGAFLGIGLPLGGNRTEVEAGLHAQLDAGFIGLRISTGEMKQWPFVLDILGERRALPFIVGQDGLREVADALLTHLVRYPDNNVISGHFSGPAAPTILDEPALAALYAHPRFSVVFSRQGIFEASLIDRWADALLDRLGWERILWGTESPVLFWRDEPAAPTRQWIERFKPSPEQREAFFGGNASRLIETHRRPVKPLSMPFDPWKDNPHRRSPFYPFGINVRSDIGGRLVHGWIAWGGETRGPLSHYIDEVLDKILPDFGR
ncbi:amidohydrolase family protein [Devosia nitrariae]|uniref:Amidohydrolase-related domain-containing protein n=1 Tax=Devosia nitrariae TaxID=2071872 RepID=A0ABQ5W6K0_9HYPH|nr:amidohydrolase family protein [Devosia nitrariae]GLQ55602.1 hypothetical protein GCM10010862_28610 [Devosia nitrariae]